MKRYYRSLWTELIKVKRNIHEGEKFEFLMLLLIPLWTEKNAYIGSIVGSSIGMVAEFLFKIMKIVTMFLQETRPISKM